MSNKTKWPQVVAGFIIDNLTFLLTIGFAVFIIYRQKIAQIAVSTDDLLTSILGILALLAISETVERYRKIDRIQKAVNRSLSFLESRLLDRPTADAFFQKPSNLDQYIQSANQIDLCGVTLSSTVKNQYGNLLGRLQAGAKVRILIADPDSIALKMSAERSVDPDDVDIYRVRLDGTLRDIDHLFKDWENIKVLHKKSAKISELSVRVLSYSPSFGIISLKTDQENGIVFVEIYSHKSGYEDPPTFDLVPTRELKWYKHFVNQFDEMWNAAKPWKPESKKKPA